MRNALILTIGALAGALALPPAVHAQAADDARPRDLQRLEEDLANLDQELASLRSGDPRADDFRSRAEEIREEGIYLKVKARKHKRAGGDGTGIPYQEVSELRRSVRDLRDDIGRSAGRSDAPRELRLDTGTRLLVRLEDSISSKTARREDRIEASLSRPVMLRDTIALPAGTRVRVLVRDVEAAQRPSKGGRLELDFDALYLGSQRLDIRSRVVSLGDEGSGGKTAERAGIGAAIGGVVGAILGGKEGAIVGIIVGGGGAVAASKGEDVVLPAGTIVTISLESPLSIPPSR